MKGSQQLKLVSIHLSLSVGLTFSVPLGPAFFNFPKAVRMENSQVFSCFPVQGTDRVAAFSASILSLLARFL